MSVKSIRQALEVALNTWATANTTPIAWQNVPYKPSEGSVYVRASLIPAETLNPTLGDAFNRKIGIFQLLIYAKEGNGNSASETLADSLLTYFARGESFTAGSITVRILESPSISPAINDGGWYIVPVSVRYSVDIF